MGTQGMMGVEVVKEGRYITQAVCTSEVAEVYEVKVEEIGKILREQAPEVWNLLELISSKKIELIESKALKIQSLLFGTLKD